MLGLAALQIVGDATVDDLVADLELVFFVSRFVIARDPFLTSTAPARLGGGLFAYRIRIAASRLFG